VFLLTVLYDPTAFDPSQADEHLTYFTSSGFFWNVGVLTALHVLHVDSSQKLLTLEDTPLAA
jgi:hypothetical protein